MQIVYITSSLPGTTLYSTSIITSTAVLPASTEFVTHTLSLAETPTNPPDLGATVSPTASWASAEGQASPVQVQTITTVSLLPGAVVTSIAFLPGLTIEKTVSLSLFRTVTAVIMQRETLNFYVTSTLPQQTITSTVLATTTIPQATVSFTSTQYIGPPIAEVRADSLLALGSILSDRCML